MADVTQQRAAIAETRARIDARLEELAQHVPDPQDVKAVAIRYGGAAIGVLAGITVVVLATKSRLHDRKVRSDARTYAATLMKGLPLVAEAYVAHTASQPVAPPSRKDTKQALKAQAARQALELAHARELASVEAGVDHHPPRGGVGAAVLMGVGVVSGVAVAQALGSRRAAG